LTFINKLKPVTYNLDLDAADKIVQHSSLTSADAKEKQPSAEKLEERKRKEEVVYTGFVAQEVEKVAKELNFDFSGVDAAKNEKDLYGLRYAEFVVPLVKAVQELSEQNQQLKKENEDVAKRLSKLESIFNNQQSMINNQSVVLSGSTGKATAEESLSQNIPNPFDKRTTINYTLPSQYTSAKIVIVDKNGAVLKQITVTGKGQGSLQIDAAMLAAGAYHYSLFVDGKLIASKQMEHLK
jgi:hypothetical protein